ncbi:DUF1254 domain-containing protein [Rhodococcus sp. FXJ9.536]|uniref:DUF1254 domain-containing protein n=1 Tax=Rhodococcus tibetensis TaxID=2965064 RepID=A0ABT1QJB2_9NOCA|nr:DUF1254 domain-containing protein [Rhodococcus sp. FXJ9.536]MCQ4121738.1 DUF1254 domain-containing protein [Rhodococcus sp. FXJ9.536]
MWLLQLPQRRTGGEAANGQEKVLGAELQELAAKAWMYGFPQVFDLDQVNRFVSEGKGSLDAGPFNWFSHARTLAGPRDTFVSVNNDTICSIAQMDLTHGPQLLTVPDTGGTYYVLQFVDAWTNNFAYVGKRATGTSAGTYRLTGPGWEAGVLEGATRISFPTAVGSIIGRWACEGEDDLPRVQELQSGLALTPVGDHDPASGLPTPDPNVPEELAFWEKLRVYALAYPPAPGTSWCSRRSRRSGCSKSGRPRTSKRLPISRPC